ncbi:hypothetical protein EKO04_001745 [Ascochyta lentis]|uniref:Uncharacterized protein n=1 Tax=Ascochyta lentis TaxID=205686 RepID=A0A8H7MM32_9PLEO|nr:hypothetical protein EKO04_001745 [Ascochyta lentis]
MHWLQAEEDGSYDLQALQLDIVGFLAILGEGSVLANAQVSTLSRWIFLPRLIPAPQALMRPARPLELEPVPGFVSGVWSGNDRDNINHIANIVCDANNLPPFSVRVVTIKRVDENRPLKVRTFAPLTVVAVIGCSLSILLLVLSIQLRDGMSIIATVLLSLLSTLIGLGNFWTLRLPKRLIDKQKKDQKSKQGKQHERPRAEKSPDDSKDNNQDYVPPGDLVIRYPRGTFLVVRCHENVARELYFAPEEIDYYLKPAWAYRLLSLVGTMMLMGGVICLANAKIESQIAWAGSYMLLGSSYWIVAALPGKLHWDTSAYEVVPEALSDSIQTEKGLFYSPSQTFTQALWKAIVVSKDTAWVRRNNACPSTTTWDDWLQMAKSCSSDFKEDAAKSIVNGVKTWEIPPWDPQEYFSKLLQTEAEKRGVGHLAMHA